MRNNNTKKVLIGNSQKVHYEAARQRFHAAYLLQRFNAYNCCWNNLPKLKGVKVAVFLVCGSEKPDELDAAVKELCARESDIEFFYLVEGTWFLSTSLLVRELHNLMLFGQKLLFKLQLYKIFWEATK